MISDNVINYLALLLEYVTIQDDAYREEWYGSRMASIWREATKKDLALIQKISDTSWNYLCQYKREVKNVQDEVPF